MVWLTDRRLLAAALLAWAAIAAIGLASEHPLGHDEAAYAVSARDGTTWIYRSDGMVAIARLGLWLGGAEWQLRLVATLVAALAPLAVVAVSRAACPARADGSPSTGAWAVALLAGAHPMALRNAALLGDLPAMAAILFGMALLVGELDRAGGPRWRLLAAAPCLAVAFYVRYGSAPTIAAAVGLALALWWRSVRARPAPVLAMGALLAALLAPHLLRSHAATGELLGILHISAAVSGRAYLGDGLVTYLTSNPLRFYGTLVAPVMLIGALGAIVRPQLRRKPTAYLALVALAQIAALGLQTHAEARYVFVATALLVVLGIEALRGARWAGPFAARAALTAVAAAWLILATSAASHFHRLDRARAPMIAAARTIRVHAGGRGCAVIAPYAPQLDWYSGCDVYQAPEQPLPPHQPRYAASFAHRPMSLPLILQGQDARATSLATSDPRARVWLLEAAHTTMR